jgi:hypothetical protein
MASGWHTQDPADSGGIVLGESPKQTKRLLQLYYQGARLDSPMGGFLEPLGVRPEADGSGTALFECSASSLRFRLTIPKATRTERACVKKDVEAGRDANCPRHLEPPRRLQRVGGNLACPACGVPFGRAP